MMRIRFTFPGMLAVAMWTLALLTAILYNVPSMSFCDPPAVSSEIQSSLVVSADCAERPATRFVTQAVEKVNAPENTMAALKYAKGMGADGCELDLRSTLDGMLVLLRDETLERTAGVPRAIAEMNWNDCAKLKVGIPGAEERPEPIPTFYEVLGYMSREGLIPLVDVKDENTELKYVGMIRKFGLTDRTMFLAYSPEQSRRIREQDPRFLPMLQIFPMDGEGEDEYFGRAMSMLEKGDTVGLCTAFMSPALLARFHGRGIVVLAGVAHDKETNERVLNEGYDFIVTDSASFIPGR